MLRPVNAHIVSNNQRRSVGESNAIGTSNHKLATHGGANHCASNNTAIFLANVHIPNGRAEPHADA